MDGVELRQKGGMDTQSHSPPYIITCRNDRPSGYRHPLHLREKWDTETTKEDIKENQDNMHNNKQH